MSDKHLTGNPCHYNGRFPVKFEKNRRGLLEVSLLDGFYIGTYESKQQAARDLAAISRINHRLGRMLRNGK